MKQKKHQQGNVMCRSFTSRRQSSWRRILPCITIFDDPKKLAQLNAEAERRKLGLSKTD